MRRSVCLLGLCAFAALTGRARPAAAHSEDSPYDRRYRAPIRDQLEYRSPQFLAVEVRGGPYRPNVDSEFGAGPGPFQQVFGDGQSIGFGFEVDYQALRIPHFGTLGPGLGALFAVYDTRGQFANGSGISQHPITFWMAPIYALAVLRMDVLAREFRVPLVPYAKAGVVGALWEARDAGEPSVDVQNRKGQGFELGWSLHAGLMLQLNFLAPANAVDMDNSTGINNAYLFGELMLSDVSSFGQGMQVGTNTFLVGLAVEY